MKISKKQLNIAFFTIGMSAASAFAGPTVTVTVQNLATTGDLISQTISSNEITTKANASPAPAATIVPGATNTFNVTSTISPSVNYAALRYKLGAKTCVFYTAFTLVGSTPSWSKTATPSGGATCTATITSQNLSTYVWAVKFTMK